MKEFSYIVELAVCVEDGTWGVETVTVHSKTPIEEMLNGDILELAIAEFEKEAYKNYPYVAIGLYHYSYL
jgi:hypothetical protein